MSRNWKSTIITRLDELPESKNVVILADDIQKIAISGFSTTKKIHKEASEIVMVKERQTFMYL